MSLHVHIVHQAYTLNSPRDRWQFRTNGHHELTIRNSRVGNMSVPLIRIHTVTFIVVTIPSQPRVGPRFLEMSTITRRLINASRV
ncbi:MAG: hypothetical protein IT444_05105 [Phycisphaeraceae bacterium]|nr:hypothetical protein [Phycisphaeraceae bacterium]